MIQQNGTKKNPVVPHHHCHLYDLSSVQLNEFVEVYDFEDMITIWQIWNVLQRRVGKYCISHIMMSHPNEAQKDNVLNVMQQVILYLPLKIFFFQLMVSTSHQWWKKLENCLFCSHLSDHKKWHLKWVVETFYIAFVICVQIMKGSLAKCSLRTLSNDSCKHNSKVRYQPSPPPGGGVVPWWNKFLVIEITLILMMILDRELPFVHSGGEKEQFKVA